MEAACMTYARRELHLKLSRANLFRVSSGDDRGILACTHDALVQNTSHGAEFKFVGPSHEAEWGDDGTDHVPNAVLIQTQHQMYVSKLDIVWVIAAIVRYTLEWHWYKIERNDRLVKAIVNTCVRFYHEHIRANIAPPDCIPSLDTLKAIPRIRGRIVSIPKSLVDAYERCHTASSVIKETTQRADAALIAALGDAEIGDYGDPQKWITYRMVHRREHVVKASCGPRLLHTKRVKER
jgi:hypothetical protein